MVLIARCAALSATAATFSTSAMGFTKFTQIHVVTSPQWAAFTRAHHNYLGYIDEYIRKGTRTRNVEYNDCTGKPINSCGSKVWYLLVLKHSINHSHTDTDEVEPALHAAGGAIFMWLKAWSLHSTFYLFHLWGSSPPSLMQIFTHTHRNRDSMVLIDSVIVIDYVYTYEKWAG